MPDGTTQPPERPSYEQLEKQILQLNRANLLLQAQFTEIQLQLMEATVANIQHNFPKAEQELARLRALLSQQVPTP